mgnify:FL=1
MNSNTVIGASPMQPVRKDSQSSNLFPKKIDNCKELGDGILRQETSGNQQLLKVSIFSPDRFIRDFLKGILTFQGYRCANVDDIQGIVWDFSVHEEQVVFLDGRYFEGSEAEHVRRSVQQFTQAGGHVMILASRHEDAALMAIQNTGGCQILWKPLDYRQVGQVMAHM